MTTTPRPHAPACALPTLQRITRSLRRALLGAHQAQLQLTLQHTALHHPTDLLTQRRLSARLALVQLELVLIHAQTKARP